jgi:hypothetical protein
MSLISKAFAPDNIFVRDRSAGASSEAEGWESALLVAMACESKEKEPSRASGYFHAVSLPEGHTRGGVCTLMVYAVASGELLFRPMVFIGRN